MTAPRIKPRKPEFDFASVPKHWFGGNAAATAMANGVNLLFPAGERFFVRSVRHYQSRYKDQPERMADIRGFFGQEGAHANAHERQVEFLEAQGYVVRPFLDWYERLAFEVLEPRFGPELSLAVTAACEHYTALMADGGLREGQGHMHPVMAELLSWHAAEEIEHKAVAFDMLQDVNDSLLLRAAGMALATLGLAGFWITAMVMLLRQDGVSLLEARRQIERGRAKIAESSGQPQRSMARDVFLAGIREYLQPGFHPWNHDNRDLIAEVIARYDGPVAQAAE